MRSNLPVLVMSFFMMAACAKTDNDSREAAIVDPDGNILMSLTQEYKGRLNFCFYEYNVHDKDKMVKPIHTKALSPQKRIDLWNSLPPKTFLVGAAATAACAAFAPCGLAVVGGTSGAVILAGGMMTGVSVLFADAISKGQRWELEGIRREVFELAQPKRTSSTKDYYDDEKRWITHQKPNTNTSCNAMPVAELKKLNSL
jgi:hypothetical protein